jgi:phospholipase C
LHLRKKLIAAVAGVAAIGVSAIGLSVSTASSPHQDATTVATTTPIKHVVVIFGENISFDHYFGTYPFATNPPNEPQFHAAPGTPNVNGLNDALLTANPNLNNPARLDPSQALTCDMNHGYSAEQSADDSGLMDKFVQDTTGNGCLPQNGGQSTFPDQGNYAPNGIVMDYYDGNTVTALWNYAQHYTLNDNSYSTQFGPSTPGALNLISGQTNGTTLHGATTASSVANNTMIGDAEPFYDQCSNASTALNADGTPGGITASLSGPNVGDLLNRKNITWGWFQGGFTPSAISAGRAICGTSHNNIGNSPSADYSEHHEPFQYYASTSNPDHVSPSSLSQVGVSDPAGTPATQAINHQYDVSWFNGLLKAGDTLPSISYLKAPEYEDGHAGYSDPLDEQRFVVDEVNQIEQSKDWSSTAIILAYDDSDGWYDHQLGPIIRQSQDTADTLSGPGKCGSAATPPAQNDRCGVGPRQPLLVISPWAKQNFVDNTFTDQASILRFIEDNWNLGRIGGGSADSAAGNLDNAFDFNQKFGHAPAVILDDNTGEVTKVIQPNGQESSSSVAPSGTGAQSGSPSSTSSSGGRGATLPKSVAVIKLPNVSLKYVRKGKRSLVLTATTRGGSKVQTLIRARLYQDRQLVSNKAGLVKHNRVRLTLSLGRQSRGARYTIRLSIDAGGRVGSLTRNVR